MTAKSKSGQSHVPKGDFTWVIGSDPALKNDPDRGLYVDLPGIEPRHLRFRRTGNRCFIQDLHSKAGTFLNGAKLHNRAWAEVSRYDQIKVGPQPFTIHPQVFFGGGLAGLESTPLQFDVGGRKGLICDGSFIRAKPGTITAIMGPSGAGKSVLLNLLNGYNHPTNGHVLVGGQFDVHGAGGAKAVRDFVGFVPQAEVMIPELTVLQSLCYRLRLRYPDIKRDFSERFAAQVCSRLGFDPTRLQEFLHKRIGSPESRGEVLSGGERRRANIAHELVCRTQVLLLDEPTSGLSSVDADEIVALLHDLAKQDGLTIITTVHQPSRDAFSRFDDLLLMSYGGKVAYYGSAQQAPSYLEHGTPKRCGNRNPAEFVLDVLREPADRDRLTKKFANTAARPSSIPSPLAAGAAQKRKGSSPQLGCFRARVIQAILSPFSRLAECKTLVARNLRVLRSDWVHLLFSVGQVPLIAFLMFLAFHHVYQDNASYDVFARRFYHFGQALSEHEAGGGGAFPAEAEWRRAANKADEAGALISQATARQRASIIFTLVVAAVWFGIMGACKEIVTEQHIVQRESRSCIRLGPYVLSKAAVQILLIAIQTGLLTAFVVPPMLSLPVADTMRMWSVLWVAGTTAAALGLLISALARTYRIALTAVPMIMIPQLLFGGLLRPMATTEGITHWPQLLSYVTIQRWGFEAGLSVDRYAAKNVLQQFIDLSTGGRYAEFKIIQFQNGNLIETFFGAHGGTHMTTPIVVMLCAIVVLLVACRIVLQRRLAS